MNDKRSNQTMRTLVNMACVLAKSSVSNAAALLADHKVPIEVAKRALLKTKTRSDNGWSAK